MDTTASTGGSKSLLIRRKLAKMMLAVSIIFAICWGPYFALYLWVAAGLGIQRNGFFAAAVVEFLPIVSSALNPFIYTLNSKTFQSGLKRILFSGICRSHREDSSMYRSFASLYYPVNNNSARPQSTRALSHSRRSTRAHGHSELVRKSTFSPHMQPRANPKPGFTFSFRNYATGQRHSDIGNITMGPMSDTGALRRYKSSSTTIRNAHARRNTFLASPDFEKEHIELNRSKSEENCVNGPMAI